MTWRRAGLSGLGTYLQDVVESDGRLVAIGSAPGGPDSDIFGRSVFQSVGGRDWSMLAEQPFGGDVAIDLMVAGDRLVAVANRPGSDVEAFDPIAWWSPDGSRWTVWTPTGVGEPQPTRFARLDDRWIAVGPITDILASEDGRRWTTTWPLRGGFDQVTFVLGPGGLIAPTVIGQGDAPWFQTTMLQSSNGRDWRATLLESGATSIVHAAAADDQVYVALGSIRPAQGYRAAAWWSADGTTWQRAVVPDRTMPPYAPVFVAPWRGGFAAVYSDDSQGDPRPVVTWSRDGTSWVGADAPPEAMSITSLVAVDGELLLFGQPVTEGGPLLWIGTSE